MSFRPAAGVPCLLVTLAVGLACSDGSGPDPAAAGGAGGASVAAAGASGASGAPTGGATSSMGAVSMGAGAGGTANAGGSAGSSAGGSAGTQAAAGAAGAGGGVGGSAGESAAGGAAGAGGTAAVPEGPFTCSTMLGLLSSGEWYNAGFEDGLPEGQGDAWQGVFVHYGYVDIWADPMGYTWDEGTSSNCTEGSEAPDRLLYQAVSWELTDQQQWEDQLNAALTTIIAKYPSATRIDLMTLIRCPMNGYCHDDDPPLGYAPGYNHDATKQDCHIPDFVDAAMEAAAANFPGLVKVTPKFEAHNCAPNIDGIHLGPENGPVAADIAAYFSLPENY